MSLGITVDRVLSLFPGSSERSNIKGALETADGYPSYGIARLYFQIPEYPQAFRDRFSGIRGISVTLLDGRVVELGIYYAGIADPPLA
jgi:hypothetical protein